MIPIASPATLRRAAHHLARHDPVLAPIIQQAGQCTIRPHHNYYWELIDSIISQQLSVKAAATIEQRFRALFAGDSPEPQAILATSIEELRSVGLSRAKALYIQDLASRIVAGELKFDHFDTLSNQAIIDELVAVKGIGEWTAHMFLMFCIGRLDVLATGDLGIRNGIRTLYGLETKPTASEVVQIAKTSHWHPYETVACWYIWRSLANTPKL